MNGFTVEIRTEDGWRPVAEGVAVADTAIALARSWHARANTTARVVDSGKGTLLWDSEAGRR